MAEVYDELLALNRHRFRSRKDARRRTDEEKVAPRDIYSMGLMLALGAGKITASLLHEQLIPIPKEAWQSPRLALLGRDERHLILSSTQSARRLFERLGTTLPAGFPDGAVLLREQDFQRWLHRFKTIANQHERKNMEDDIAIELRRLLDHENRDQPRNKAEARELVKERLALAVLNGRAFDRAWRAVTGKLGRDDLRRAGRKRLRDS